MKLTGENRQLGEKPVLVPLCPPQISHGLDLGSNPGLRGERPVTDRLSHGRALKKCTLFLSYVFAILTILTPILLHGVGNNICIQTNCQQRLINF